MILREIATGRYEIRLADDSESHEVSIHGEPHCTCKVFSVRAVAWALNPDPAKSRRVWCRHLEEASPRSTDQNV
jgi:hypothetical protein